MRDIAEQFALSKSAVARHRPHLPAELLAAAGTERSDAAAELLEDLAALAVETRKILSDVKSKRDEKLKAIARLERQLSLKAKLLGELKESSVTVTVNVIDSPEWRQLMAIIAAALSKHPEARADVYAALPIQ